MPEGLYRCHSCGKREINPETFGVRLKSARRRDGYSLADLAERLRVSHQSVWDWETGKKAPDQEHRAALREMWPELS